MGYVLVCGAILSGTDSVIKGGSLRVQNGRIVQLQQKFSTSLAENGDEIIDVRPATVLPGLIDLHNHLNGNGKYSLGDDSVREPEAMWALVLASFARQELMHGVTTVRVPGAPFHVDVSVRKSIEEGYSVGPRLICAGEKLSMTGGHGFGHGYEADGVAEVIKGTRKQIKAGVDFIKLTASGGVGVTREGEAPAQPEMTVDEMAAAVAVAHAAGLKVGAHADGVPGIRNALSAGVDCIEHGIFMGEREAEDMVKRGVALVPTLAVMRGIANRGRSLGLPQSWIPMAESVLEPHMNSFQAARRAGVLFGAGTDGYCDLVEEIQIFVEAGLTPHAAIQAATREASRILGLERKIGTIEIGKEADLIAVPGDPLEDLGLLRHPNLVMRKGTIWLGQGAPV